MKYKIDDKNVSTEVLSVLAKACGFRVAFDRSPGADEWELSAGHGENHVQYVGTRQGVSAFLTGYGAMQLQTRQILNDLDSAHRKILLDMKTRIGDD